MPTSKFPKPMPRKSSALAIRQVLESSSSAVADPFTTERAIEHLMKLSDTLLKPMPMRGILVEPMERAEVHILGGYLANAKTSAEALAIRDAAARFEARQLQARFAALGEHYKADISNIYGLQQCLLSLARDFIVGFNFKDEIGNAKVGRAKRQNKTSDAEIYEEVNRLRQSKNLSLQSAFDHLRKQPGKEWAGKTMASIKARYNRRKKSLGIGARSRFVVEMDEAIARIRQEREVSS